MLPVALQAPLLPLLQLNADQNFGGACAPGGGKSQAARKGSRLRATSTPAVGELFWSTHPRVGGEGVGGAVVPPYDVVLMADVMYCEEYVDALVETARWCCEGQPHAELFVAYEERAAHIEQRFFAAAARHFDVREIGLGSLGADAAREVSAAIEKPEEIHIVRMTPRFDFAS